ncbi:hypothetical protein PMAYCL1PPCAC_03985, partial [Pristionchus mayeri]
SGCIQLYVHCPTNSATTAPFPFGQSSQLYCNNGLVFQDDFHEESPLTSIGCYSAECACKLVIYNNELCTIMGKNCLPIAPEVDYDQATGCVTGMRLTCLARGNLIVRLV